MRNNANELINKINNSEKKELKKYLIKHSKKIKKQVNTVVDQYGKSLLHLTAWRNLDSAAKVLLDLGADVNKVDNNGNSPLTIAIYFKRPEMVELLLKYKPDFYNKITRRAFYACFSETDSYKRRIIKSMIKHGFKIDPIKDQFVSATLMTCIRLGYMDMAISITKCKTKNYDFLYDILVWYKYLKSNSRPYTKIQNKILNRLTNILNLLHIRVSQLYIIRNYHVTEILCCDDLEDLPTISLLINNTSFHNFGYNYIDSYVQSVILNCYDANEPFCNLYQRNFLHYICINYSRLRVTYALRVLRVLLNMNFDINAVDRLGRTPLDYASEGYFSARNRSLEEYIKYNGLITEFRKYITKLLSANFYVSENNLRVIETLYRSMSDLSSSGIYIRSILIETERMTEELSRIREYRVGDFSLYDLFLMDITNFCPFDNSKEVRELFQWTNNISVNFPYFGPLLQRKYEELHTKRGLVSAATTVLYETLQYRISQLVVHQIAQKLTKDELFQLLYVDP